MGLKNWFVANKVISITKDEMEKLWLLPQQDFDILRFSYALWLYEDTLDGRTPDRAAKLWDRWNAKRKALEGERGKSVKWAEAVIRETHARALWNLAAGDPKLGRTLQDLIYTCMGAKGS